MNKGKIVYFNPEYTQEMDVELILGGNENWLDKKMLWFAFHSCDIQILKIREIWPYGETVIE